MSSPVNTPAVADQARVRVAARALARAQLAHAYGHCSLRLDAGHFLVCAARPMGLIAPGEPGIVVPVQGELPAGVLGEVRIHQQIYRARPDVGGVARTMPPTVMSLSAARVTPVPRHGMGSYFWPAVPLWDDPLLVRSDAQAHGVAQALGGACAVVMRGNGAVVAAPTLMQAVVLTWYLEDAARIEWQLRAAGLADGGPLFDEAQARERAVGTGRIYERMWEYLADGDPEYADAGGCD
ncbi:MAG TPA: class II aldolase/adducin family protein [Bordetella sp.]|nr:class II aldolase/adducin family protein [Bordetella sp.]